MAPHHGRGTARPEGRRDAPGDQDRTQRDVARGDALGTEQDVGIERPAFAGEHRTRAPIAADHLVGHEEDPAPTAYVAHASQVVTGRCVDTARPDDRFAEERRNVRSRTKKRLKGVRVIPGHLHDGGIEVAVARSIGLDARQARPREVHAVIGVLARDDHRA